MDFSIFVYKILLSMNIEIDDELMKKALKYSKLKTKKEVINEALNAYVKYQMRLKLLSLCGKVKWVGDLDKMRTYDKWEDASKIN
jgi:Arc/MetJ family transcription regulator